MKLYWCNPDGTQIELSKAKPIPMGRTSIASYWAFDGRISIERIRARIKELKRESR